MKNAILVVLGVLFLAAVGTIAVREVQFRQAKAALMEELANTETELMKTHVLATVASMAWNRYSGPYSKETLDALSLAIDNPRLVQFVSSSDGKSTAARIPVGEMALYYQSLEGMDSLSFEKNMGPPILPYRTRDGIFMFPSNNPKPPPPSIP